MKKVLKRENGITLVAMVITIIILLILAGITISQLAGNGIFEKTKKAKLKYGNAQIEEDETIENYINSIDFFAKSNRNFGFQDEELYDLSKYSQEGLTIYDSRIINLQGGYKVDGNLVYVFITGTINKTLESTLGSWRLIDGFPKTREISPLDGVATLGDSIVPLNTVGIYNDSTESTRLAFNGKLEKNTNVVIRGCYYKASE